MNKAYGALAVKNHLERMEKIQQIRPIPQNKLHGRGEAEVVPGYELSEILREWVVQRLAENNSTHEWLAEKTGLHVRRVSGIINGEYVCVPLSQADKLLQAIERTDLYHVVPARIHVIPNPNWSQERWQEYMEERGGC